MKSFRECSKYIGGEKVKEGRSIIIEELKKNGLLIKSENITHTTNVHERCGKEIEILPSKQWYIDILSHKDEFLEAGDKINWHPQYMKARYDMWVKNLKWDWCISRQRYFGVPFPVWYCKNCHETIVASDDMMNKSSGPINPLEIMPEGVCPHCGCNEFVPETAVLDTWATSSLSPDINRQSGKSKDLTSKLTPFSMRTQAHEIIRTWAFYSIVKSLYHHNEIPWKDIMICGFVLAKKGEKISKSKNNAKMSPQALIEKYSADSIRYWAASCRLGTDTMFAEEDIKISQKFINKLYNASKFSIMHLNDYKKPTEDINRIKNHFMSVDRWIIDKCNYTIKKAAGYLEKYETGLARHEIDNFFWNDFCDYYIEIVKDRLYKPEVHGACNRNSAQNAVYYCTLQILRMYSIFVPHITEYIYRDYFIQWENSISLHTLEYDMDNLNYNDKLLSFGEKLKEEISKVRKYKSENNMSVKDSIDSITINCSEEFIEFFRDCEKDILCCCHCDNLRINN